MAGLIPALASLVLIAGAAFVMAVIADCLLTIWEQLA